MFRPALLNVGGGDIVVGAGARLFIAQATAIALEPPVPLPSVPEAGRRDAGSLLGLRHWGTVVRLQTPNPANPTRASLLRIRLAPGARHVEPMPFVIFAPDPGTYQLRLCADLIVFLRQGDANEEQSVLLCAREAVWVVRER